MITNNTKRQEGKAEILKDTNYKKIAVEKKLQTK